MTYYRISRSLRLACASILLMAAASYAEADPSAGNPQTNASDRNFDTNQPNSIPGAAQKTQDAGNRALNKVDNAVHDVAHKTKRGAKKAKRKTNEAAEKTGDTIKSGADQATEPATKPAY